MRLPDQPITLTANGRARVLEPDREPPAPFGWLRMQLPWRVLGWVWGIVRRMF